MSDCLLYCAINLAGSLAGGVELDGGTGHFNVAAVGHQVVQRVACTISEVDTPIIVGSELPSVGCYTSIGDDVAVFVGIPSHLLAVICWIPSVEVANKIHIVNLHTIESVVGKVECHIVNTLAGCSLDVAATIGEVTGDAASEGAAVDLVIP